MPKRRRIEAPAGQQALYKGLIARAKRLLVKALGRPLPGPEELEDLARDAVVIASAQVRDLQHVGEDELGAAVRKVRSKVRAALEKELRFGESPEQQTATERAEFEAWKRRQEPGTEARPVGAEIEEQLARMETGPPEEQVKATIVRLHRGQRVLPDQPLPFIGTKPSADLARYHRLRDPKGEVCPTCKAITRYLRVRGLTEQDVSRIVNTFLFQLER